MPWNSAGGGTSCDWLEKIRRTSSTKQMPSPKVHEQLILVGAMIEMADDDAFHEDAEQHHEQRARDDGENERFRVLVGDEAGIAADHEHRAMREVEHAERAVNDGQAGADQREQGAEREPVEKLRNEIGPTNHATIAVVTRDGAHQKR
ncbi:hypothetical protein ACVW0I_008389 [Bradyrhizobium sp. LM6.11]